MTQSSFGFLKPEQSPGYMLWQTTMDWQRLIRRALEDYEVSHAQFVIMAQILWFEENVEEINQIDIIDWSKLDKMTVSKSLRTLVERKWVLRNESDSDSRAKSVALSSVGRRKIKKLIPIVEKVDEDFFSKLSKEDRKTMIRLFSIIGKNE